jgi:RNA polymerase sigma-70 factor, ECF subfamily
MQGRTSRARARPLLRPPRRVRCLRLVDSASTPSDEALFEAFRGSKDKAAFAELYGRYERRLLRFALGSVVVRAVAEDVLHETWIRVLKQAANWRPVQPFRTWLFAIARNLCIDYLRTSKRHVDTKPREGEEDREEKPLPGAVVDAAEPDPFLLEVLQTAVRDELTAEQAETLMLVAERFTAEEIAEVTGVPRNTVKSRLHQARLRLQKHLGALGVSGPPGRRGGSA